MYLARGKTQKGRPSFDVCYVSESPGGPESSLCFSTANHFSKDSLILPHGTENEQLLQYGHAYQWTMFIILLFYIMHATSRGTAWPQVAHTILQNMHSFQSTADKPE